jgi:hypothetical protein
MRKFADVAQLVERHLAKVKVAGSIPVVRSTQSPGDSPGLSSFSAAVTADRSDVAGTSQRRRFIT